MWFSSKRSGATPARRRRAFQPRLETHDERCLLSGGVLDPSFGNGGLVTTAIGSQARSFAVATDPNNGKVVAVGDSFTSNKEFLTIARYNLDGSLDASFGGTGLVTRGNGEIGMGVAVQPDDKIVVVTTGEGRFTVYRYNRDGTLDSSFGSSGTVAISHFSTNSSEVSLNVALQADGKIVVAG